MPCRMVGVLRKMSDRLRRARLSLPVMQVVFKALDFKSDLTLLAPFGMTRGFLNHRPADRFRSQNALANRRLMGYDQWTLGRWPILFAIALATASTGKSCIAPLVLIRSAPAPD